MANSFDYPYYFVVEDDVLIKYDGYESEVIVPSGIVAIENKAFWYNKFVSKVILPNTVKVIGSYAFCGCTALAEVELSDGVIHIGKMAFNGCKNLKSINIPDTVEELGAQAFGNCKSLPQITLPPVKKIPECALAGCESLEIIEVPDGTKTIGEAAFYACKDVETVVIPKSVETIKPLAFEECDSVEEIHYLGSENDFNKIDKQTDWNSSVKNANVEYAGNAKRTEAPKPTSPAPSSTSAPTKPAESKKKKSSIDMDIGDTVIVIDDMLRYPSYKDWFKTYAPELLDKFAYNESIPAGTFTLVKMEPHTSDRTLLICCLRHDKNGKYYLVARKGVMLAPEKDMSSPTSASAPAVVKKPQPQIQGNTAVTSPFPGVITEIKVSVGQAVKKGDVVCVIDAMKMLNEIPATDDGVIVSINVNKGQEVFSSDKLVTLNACTLPTDIKVGDEVVVTDDMQRYTMYTAWFDTYAPEMLAKFARGEEIIPKGRFTLMRIAPHTSDKSVFVCCLKHNANGKYYLIQKKGVAKATAPAAAPTPATTSSSNPNNPLGLKVGDIVSVSDAGKQYSTYTSWLDTNAPTLKSKFVSNRKVPTTQSFKIAAIANHSVGNTTVLAAVEDGSSVYIMGVLGLKRSTDTVTTESYSVPTDMKPGDTVVVTDDMQRYTMYTAWFDAYAPELRSGFAYKEEVIPSGTFTLVKIAPHTSDKSVFVCCLKHNGNGKYYLIQKKGVAKAPTAPAKTAVVSNSTNNPNDVKVGDTVIVSDSGKRYSSYSAWFNENAPHLASRFAKDKSLPSGTFTVLEMAYHSKGSTTICCAIESSADKSVHLIGAAGLKKSASQSTSYSVPTDMKPGDTVVVTDDMQRYTMYTAWFDAYAPELRSGFAYKEEVIPSGTFTLVKIAPHTSDKSVYVCCLKHNGNGKYYLIQKKGVAKATGGTTTASSLSTSTPKMPTYTSNSTNNPNGVKIGDTVVISNSGQRYPSYSAWFDDNAPHLKSRFAKDKELDSGNYTILTMGMHSSGSTTLCCAIESVSTKQVYLIGATGVKKAGTTSSFGGTSFGNLSNNPNGLKVGDTVVVTNSGKQYTTYSSWIDKNAPHLKASFAYSVSINTSARYEIVAAAPHSVGSDTMVCAVKSKSDGKVYLIGALGIKRA